MLCIFYHKKWFCVCSMKVSFSVCVFNSSGLRTDELVPWGGIGLPPVHPNSQESLLFLEHWSEFYQTCGQRSPNGSSSKLCPRSRSHVSRYGLIFMDTNNFTTFFLMMYWTIFNSKPLPFINIRFSMHKLIKTLNWNEELSDVIALILFHVASC